MPISRYFGKIKSKADSIIYSKLTKAANTFAGMLKASINENNLPEVIANSIIVGEVKSGKKGKYIDVIIPLQEAPMAAAFEYGSGIHSTTGDQSTYRISPKNASVLAFPWQPRYIPWNSPKFAGVAGRSKGSTAGQYFFNWIDHPGVAPKPFIEPNIERIALECAQSFNGLIIEVIVGNSPAREVIS